jgi:uncharacterized protein (TIGR02246 family)
MTTNVSSVETVLDEIYAAWAAGDADAFVAPYAEHATATLPGTYLPGKEAIRTAMALAFSGPLHGTRAVHEVRDIRYVGDGTAIVNSKGAVVPAGQTEPDAATRSLDTWVLSKQDGTWLVQAFHNCQE